MYVVASGKFSSGTFRRVLSRKGESITPRIEITSPHTPRSISAESIATGSSSFLPAPKYCAAVMPTPTDKPIARAR
jgi:hypothetical protein